MGGCGCKNKNNGNQVPQPQTAQPVQNNTQNSPTIQESIKKVVLKRGDEIKFLGSYLQTI
jgi:hypothetical protein